MTARARLLRLLLVPALAAGALNGAGPARAADLGPLTSYLGGQRSVTDPAVTAYDSFSGAVRALSAAAPAVSSAGAWQTSGTGSWSTGGAGTAGLTGTEPSGALTVPVPSAAADVTAKLGSPTSVQLGRGTLLALEVATAVYGASVHAGAAGRVSGGLSCTYTVVLVTLNYNASTTCRVDLRETLADGTTRALGSCPTATVLESSTPTVRLRSDGTTASLFLDGSTTPACSGAVSAALQAQRGAGVAMATTGVVRSPATALASVAVVPGARVG